MPVAPDIVACSARVSRLLQRRCDRKDGLDMPQIDDLRRLWPEGRNVTEAARVTGYDRMTVGKHLPLDVF